MAVLQQDSAVKPLIAIQSEMSRSSDFTSASKLDDLIYKSISREKQIAFTGHFSAGKSTLLNTLLEEEILPASPIPTSANLVYVRRGEKRILLETHGGEQAEANPDMNLDELQQYAREGNEIAKIHIWKPSHLLPEAVALLDTPGVDSNDAAHMESTLSALHAADFIFYVTDYNHVQSEGTFEFIKKLIEDGQEAALIVNQIDKHREEELPFYQFQLRIEESFKEIGLKEDRIFYTTMKDANHPFNELKKVKKIIENELSSEQKRSESLQAELVIHEHVRFLENQAGVKAEEKPAAEQKISRLSTELNRIQDQADEGKKAISTAVKRARADMGNILANANITPFEMREHAKRFVESRKPGFKAGLIFAKKKTEEEMAKRSSTYTAALKDLVSSQIDWHIKDLLSKTHRALNLSDPKIEADISSFATGGLDEIILKSLHENADATPEYVMNYTKSTAEHVKADAKKQAQMILDNLEQCAMQRLSDQHSIDSSKQLRIELEEAEEKLAKITELMEKKEHLLKILSGDWPAEADEKAWLHTKKIRTAIPSIMKKKEHSTEKAASLAEHSVYEAGSLDTERVVETAMEMARLAQNVKGLEGRRLLINEKSNRLKDRTFTIALFGAFSAGKSSAANALLGGKVLPSSPNPTTAAINRIVPVSPNHGHGTVAVKRKSVSKLCAEMMEILPEVIFQAETYSELLHITETLLSGDQPDQRQKDALSVYADGLRAHDWGGESVYWTDLNSFAPFVSEEKLAVLTEEAVIYYDCALTRRGISLVDTPGADSLNKRHTDVAFQFIKQSDALLYVTYYNHPFSKGDREFIRQLGRVKDSFSLDKMFFLINAIDLAKDSREVTLVKDYIQSQFLQEGIRQPRMYGISSLHELTGKQMEVQSDFALFKADLGRFIEADLIQTAVSSLKDEMSGLIGQLSSYMEEMNKSEDEKKMVLMQKEKERSDASEYLGRESTEPFIKNVNQEITEQFYYLIQRIGLQFSEMFKEHFHPGIFNQEGSIKSILNHQMDELIQFTDRRLSQELQAITLRCEKKVMEQMVQFGEKLSANLNTIMNLEGLTVPEPAGIDTPSFSGVLRKKAADYQQELSLFTNTKVYFEKDGRVKMSEAVWKKLHKELEMRLSECEADFSKFYREELNEQAARLAEKFRGDADAYVEGLKQLYQDTESAEQLKHTYEQSVKIYGALSYE